MRIDLKKPLEEYDSKFNNDNCYSVTSILWKNVSTIITSITFIIVPGVIT